MVYVTYDNRTLGHTKNPNGEYCNIVPDHCIDHKTYESRSSNIQAYNLEQPTFSEYPPSVY